MEFVRWALPTQDWWATIAMEFVRWAMPTQDWWAVPTLRSHPPNGLIIVIIKSLWGIHSLSVPRNDFLPSPQRDLCNVVVY
jgi:hypothetical protein